MENKLNLPPFYVGEQVLAVESSLSGTVSKGGEYMVTGLKKNCSCGYKVNVDNHSAVKVGGKPSKPGDPAACFSCGDTYVSDGLNWYLSKRFVSKKQTKFPLITLEKIKETEKEEILIAN